jgi:hypothetical protein
MGALVQAHANNIIDASLGTASFTATTTPLKCRLMTANGSATSAGTEATGGSYASQTATFGSASAGSAASSGALTYSSMPAVTVVGVELWDSAGTPARKWWGALTANKTLNSGDTFSIASGSLTAALS